MLGEILDHLKTMLDHWRFWCWEKFAPGENNTQHCHYSRCWKKCWIAWITLHWTVLHSNTFVGWNAGPNVGRNVKLHRRGFNVLMETKGFINLIFQDYFTLSKDDWIISDDGNINFHHFFAWPRIKSAVVSKNRQNLFMIDKDNYRQGREKNQH